jgi:Putative Actinobacterial Holin-X, holin superfamily III
MKSAYSEASLFGLLRELREEIKTFVKQEIQLAKTEVSEKMSCFGRNAAWLGLGGLIAYAGFIVLLAGLGSLLAHVFGRAGMEGTMANFLGLGIVGLVIALAGLAFVMKALNAFKGASLAPEKALHTLKELKPGQTLPEPEETKPEKKPSSTELESDVDVTVTRIEETTEELRERLTPRHMRHALVQQIKSHPVASGSIGAGAGLLGCLLIWRKFRQARA